MGVPIKGTPMLNLRQWSPLLLSLLQRRRSNLIKNASDPPLREVGVKMYEKDINKAALELLSRAAMLNWYVREFADKRGAEDVQAELNKERKVFAELRDLLEALTSTYEECEKQQADLQMKLDEACRKRKETIEKPGSPS
ncbi:hypothetical protein LR48_Vigan10g124500 [Vigna angularis]|uniref:Uncharacterized protein n=1 Tax=Phaseolus angularis TaxID=3914 RepID=A0A0L9VK37_PHAAN|nr:hypothetical protein LR48_Vigan10g124500 [Vigna angularis]